MTPLELEKLADAVAERVANRLANRRRLLTRPEMAEVACVSVPKLDTMKDLPRIRVGRKVLFDPHAVIRYLAEHSSEGE